jgi:DNA-directed RNA polymerase sigma subunit (sigma70/sigma32)
MVYRQEHLIKANRLVVSIARNISVDGAIPDLIQEGTWVDESSQ